MKYPNSFKDPLMEDKFGHNVADNFRWMENETDGRLATWINEQNELTHGYLSDGTDREAMKERITELFDYIKLGDLMVVGDNIIFSQNEGLQSQSVYHIQKGIDGVPKVLIDPNALSEDGNTFIQLGGHSKDNRYIAYLEARAGSDWKVIRIIDLETGETLKDEIQWVKFTFVSWQGNGFYYSAFGAPDQEKALSEKNKNQKIYYHILGEPQSKDKVIYTDLKNPLRYHSARVSEDEKALVLMSRQGTYGSQVAIRCQATGNRFETILGDLTSNYTYIGSTGQAVFFLTDNGARHGKVVKVNLKTLNVETVVPESESPLNQCFLVKGKLILLYLKDVKYQVKVVSEQGTFIKDIDLPGIGTPSLFVGSSALEPICFAYASFTEPLGFYSLDLENGTTCAFKTTAVSYDTTSYVTEQIFSKSKDGTMVPAFVSYKKDLALNGKNPALLYGYGGFNSVLTPNFGPHLIYFMERGGVYVSANLRGGSEYGENWHKAGMLHNKQNVFDDFIAVAETIIEKRFTSSDRLTVEGRSNGGLLVGAVANQRPDLFRVCLPSVGVMDMLRYHRFTIGWGWMVEYGNPDEKEHFENIVTFSPLHNIEEKAYPAVLVCTADHDDRVVPAHSYKYIAEIQDKNTGESPMLIRIDKNSGHGMGKSVEKWIDEHTDKYTFLFKNMPEDIGS